MSHDEQKAIWSAYVAHVSGELEGGTAISRHIKAANDGLGPSQSTVDRWLSGSFAPTGAADIALFARTFDRNPIEAFVAAGMLTLDEGTKALSADEIAGLRSLMSAAAGGELLTLAEKRKQRQIPGVQQEAARPKAKKPKMGDD